MSQFLEMARAYGGLADKADGSVAAMSLNDLAAVKSGFLVASAATCELLVEICGGDQEAARVELSRALDLPLSVVRRRGSEAAAIIEAGDVPDKSQIAAHAALMIRTAHEIADHIERRQRAN